MTISGELLSVKQKTIILFFSLINIYLKLYNCARESPFYFLIIYLLKSAFRTLFSYGCNMNARTIHGETALHLSIVGKKCFFECIDVLLELGCDPNIQENIRGQTPLHALVKYLIISDDYSRTSLKTLRNLFMKCNPNITDCRNRTALHYVASTHTNMLCVEVLIWNR